jgi:hypothetical protein
MRLGGGPSIIDLCPDKPPGMHWRTYGRLFNKADAEQDAGSLCSATSCADTIPVFCRVPKRHTSQPKECDG